MAHCPLLIPHLTAHTASCVADVIAAYSAAWAAYSAVIAAYSAVIAAYSAVMAAYSAVGAAYSAVMAACSAVMAAYSAVWAAHVMGSIYPLQSHFVFSPHPAAFASLTPTHSPWNQRSHYQVGVGWGGGLGWGKVGWDGVGVG